MGYSSKETLGTVKGSARLDENARFNDIWGKTKNLMTEMTGGYGFSGEGNLEGNYQLTDAKDEPINIGDIVWRFRLGSEPDDFAYYKGDTKEEAISKIPTSVKNDPYVRRKMQGGFGKSFEIKSERDLEDLKYDMERGFLDDVYDSVYEENKEGVDLGCTDESIVYSTGDKKGSEEAMSRRAVKPKYHGIVINDQGEPGGHVEVMYAPYTHNDVKYIDYDEFIEKYPGALEYYQANGNKTPDGRDIMDAFDKDSLGLSGVHDMSEEKLNEYGDNAFVGYRYIEGERRKVYKDDEGYEFYYDDYGRPVTISGY